MKKSRSERGFTLVELIIVIVLLGILAVVAVPKFINATDDARDNVIEQFFTQVNSTLEMYHGFAQVKGKTSGEQTLTLEENGDYAFIDGYPRTRSDVTSPAQYFFDLMNLGLKSNQTLSGNTRTMQVAQANTYESDTVARIGFGTNDLTAGNCYVEYQLDANNRPVVIKVVDGCN